MIHDARYFSTLENTNVQCQLCPARCVLKPGQYGICGSRYNDDGRLKTDNFGETVTVALDPIEKKPLYHFLPTSDIISIGPNGCNLSCRHCQNWQISQEKTATTYIEPDMLPRIAGQKDSVGVAYTYTEPLIWIEYILAAAPRIREAGLVNVVVSNGYINPEPLGDILPYIDAFNIDLKGMRPEFYTKVCRGELEPVLEVIKAIAASDSHLEVTNLVIPELNDSDKDFHDLGRFLASTDKSIPLHISAYHPSYKMDKPMTPTETLMRGGEILSQYLDFVFVGNVRMDKYSHTACANCGHLLIRRTGYHVVVCGLDENSACQKCGTPSKIRLVL